MAGATDIRAGRAFVELGLDKSKFVRGLRGIGRSLRRLGQTVTAVGRQVAMVGAAMVAPFVLSVKTFASFDDQMRTVKAVTNATTEEFQKLTDEAKRLGAETSFTASQVAGAMKELGRAGFAPTEILDMTDDVLNLARATDTELPRAAEIAGAAMRQFSLDSSQSTRVMDVMVATANNSAQTLDDLGESLKLAGPIAEEFGLTFEQTNKALGALANFGIKGSRAGTSLRKVMLQLADPSVRKKLEGLGVAVTGEGGEFRDLSAILSDVGVAVKDMPGPERLAFLEELFGTRAVTAGAKLAKADFDRLNNAIDNAAGTSQKTAKEMDAGLAGAFRRLASVIEGVGIEIGEALEPVLVPLIKDMSAIAKVVRRWIKANPELVAGIAGVAAAVLALGVGLIVLGSAISVVAFAFTGLATAVSFAGAVLGFILSPIGLVVLAVAAVITVLAALTAWWLTATVDAGHAPGRVYGSLGDGPASVRRHYGGANERRHGGGGEYRDVRAQSRVSRRHQCAGERVGEV
jgi:TP901 family phage tail tape measure protein